jgi:hypothetical protein
MPIPPLSDIPHRRKGVAIQERRVNPKPKKRQRPPLIPVLSAPARTAATQPFTQTEKGSIIMTRQSNSARRYGEHTTWCSEPDRPHNARSPYCERLIGSVKAVTEPDWIRTHFWVSAISPFLPGIYTPKEVAAEHQYRTGVQLICLVNGVPGLDKEFNIRSEQARTLATLLIAAADLTDGINPATIKINKSSLDIPAPGMSDMVSVPCRDFCALTCDFLGVYSWDSGLDAQK